MYNEKIQVTDIDNNITVEEVDNNLTVEETGNSLTVEELSNPTIYLTLDTYDLVNDTTPQLGGDLDYNSKGIKIVDQTVSGSIGNIVYLSGSETWDLADASSESTCKSMLGINLNSNEILTKGIYITSGLNAGSIYYLSETLGEMTTVRPTDTGTIVRILGYAISSTKFMFDPDNTYIENR